MNDAHHTKKKPCEKANARKNIYTVETVSAGTRTLKELLREFLLQNAKTD